ncbi:uncharacterized protein LOC114737311 [Neltuma alba]|uniref:uncharacterized protein LOC114737311 n=1 Tax=Neltuma alba TaxID=207710 RepID=UPI0010A3BEBB|nr:uncharacterized protein LOC114737311 [Prosopis alba]
MAMPSNRSSSSSLAAASSRSNPNLRNSEISNSVRRSFSGNPFQKPSIIANPRSFNPYTPANSPSDFPRRNSIGGRESIGSLGDLDDKENGKEHVLKSSKVRSPAASTKGMKNFMTPTISASSKITESPRKKVLTDRNEPARTSFSSAEGKSPSRKVTFGDSIDEKKFQNFSDGIIKEETHKHKSPIRKVTFADSVEEKTFQPSPDEVSEEDRDEHTASLVSEDLIAEAKSPNPNVAFADSIEEKKFEPFTDGFIKDDAEEHTSSTVSEDLKAEGLDSHNETESACEAVTNEPDCVNLDPSFRLSPTPPPFSSTSTVIAPLDADPLIPPYDPKADPLILPYDPKVNYLSPRPQFLRYKPNPRLQLYKERESMKLDDGSSDTELTEEALSGGSEKESEVSSDEIASEDQNHVSEASTINSTLTPEDEIAEAKELLNQVFDPLLKELTTWSRTCDSSEFYQFATANFDRFSQLAKDNLDGLSRNFHIWFTKWMSSTSKLISSFRGVQDSGHLHWNLTDLTENTEVYQFPTFVQDGNLIREAPQVDIPVLNVEKTDDFTDTSSDDDIGDIIMADHYASAYEEQVVQELDPVPDNDAVKEIDTDARVHEIHTEVENASPASEIGAVSEPSQSESNTDYPDSEAHEIHTEDFEANNLQAKQTPEKDAETGSVDLKDQSDLSSEVSETAEMHTDSEPASEINTVHQDVQLKSEEKYLVPVIVASILLFLSIIAGAAFKFLKKKDEGRRRMAATNTTSMEQPPMTKALQKEETFSSLERPFLRNSPIEMEVLGESYPSEMSSFERSSSHYYSQRVVREQNEAQSLEKKPKRNYRRESLASSADSMGGSASYGSFTTYEKIPKPGHGDGGSVTTVTPVRRSSRIRSLANSPL